MRLIQFVFGIILARLLTPADFGLIGMLSIFIGISQVFIDSGMGSALVQKHSPKETDYSTVFVFNFGVSLVFYAILFLAAPFIADFFNQPQLTFLTRILTLNFVFSSLGLVQRSRLLVHLDFKNLSKVNLASSFIGGIVGIIMAYTGYGVMALVAQTLTISIANVAILWLISHWTPSLKFTRESFHNLFGYGSKLLAAGIYAKLFQEIYNIIIGRAYSAGELGFYTRSRSFTEMAAQSITNIINQVSFPILSSLQHDRERMISVNKRLIRMSAFVMIPIMTLIAVLAEPIVILLLTEKWRSVIPLLQWMVFARIFYPMSAINMNLLKAIGRSDWFLKVDLAKFPVIIITLIITVPLGVNAIVVGQVFISFVAYLINTYLPGRYFGYGAGRQMKDLLPIIAISLVMAFVTGTVNYFIASNLLKLATGITLAFLVYFGLAKAIKLREFNELMVTKGQFFKVAK